MSRGLEIVESFTRRHELAGELAIYASLAVRIESGLLRTLRLELTPTAGAQAEADLWFSRLVRARGPDGIVLREDVHNVLRDRLSARCAKPETRSSVEKSWWLIRAAHDNASPALRLEERVAWLSISHQGTASVERELYRALSALEGGTRPDLARWAVNAWRRLPPSVQETRAGWLLGQVSGGKQRRLRVAAAPAGLDDVDLALLVGPDARVQLVVRRDGAALELGAITGAGAVAIEVLDTEPRLIDVIRTAAGSNERETVSIPTGEVVRLDVGQGTVQLVTAAHDVYEVPLVTRELSQTVPNGFREDVAHAQRVKDRPMLAVLGDEASDFDWALGGLGLVANAQFDLDAWLDARATLESIRTLGTDEPETNLMLGVVYNRLDDPVSSAAALERVVAVPDIDPRQEAEARALLGRAAKDLWVADWRDVAPADRRAAALRSPHLETARTCYDQAFLIDQGHWYPGINALALTAITARLIRDEPDVWLKRFGDQHEAELAAENVDRQHLALAATVTRALDAEVFRRQQAGESEDIWTRFSRADLRLLTADRPAVVASAYEEARAAAADSEPFAISAAASQLMLYRDLGIFTDAVDAALRVLEPRGDDSFSPPPPGHVRAIVFCGYRIDGPGRPEPRFAAPSESTAREMIEAAVREEHSQAEDEPILGFAAGASGGDILFHEVCAELGIPTTLLLPMPESQFTAAAVADAGPEWLERFRRLAARLEVRILALNDSLPEWLSPLQGYDIWQRHKRWLMHSALTMPGATVTLIVFSDGKPGSPSDGTAEMVDLARSRGAAVVRLPGGELTTPAAS